MNALRELMTALASMETSGLPASRVLGWLKAILQTAPELVLLVETSGKVRHLNPAAQAMFGTRLPDSGDLHVEVLVSGCWQEFLAGIPPQDGPVEGEAPPAVLVAKHGDGTGFRVAAHGATLNLASGTVHLVMLRPLEIQPVARTEERAAVPEQAVIGQNLEGIVVSWNPAAERLLGYRAEEIIGRPMMLLIPPDRQVEESLIHERLRRGNRLMEQYQTVRKAKGGRRIPVALTLSRGAQGRGLTETARRIELGPAR
jgi:PAS domain S-box-containing protein